MVSNGSGGQQRGSPCTPPSHHSRSMNGTKPRNLRLSLTRRVMSCASARLWERKVSYFLTTSLASYGARRAGAVWCGVSGWAARSSGRGTQAHD